MLQARTEPAPALSRTYRPGPDLLFFLRVRPPAWNWQQVSLLLLLVGLLCRLVRYGLQFPYWGDETAVAVNLLDRDFLGLTRQLEANQVAPIFFLWGESLAFRLLGPSELALRLLPFLASVASLYLFWHLSRLVLGPRPAALAVGLLAVARWPVTTCALVKPYSFDLFFALSLLVPAVHYLRTQERRWLILLTFLMPVALLASYPAVFVAGAVSVVLLPVAWRNGTAARAWFAAANLLLGLTFLGNFLAVGLSQLDRDHGSVHQYMLWYWRDGFPPASVWRFPLWLLQISTGRMMAYPIGDANYGSSATLLLFLGGTWALARGRRWGLLGLCLLPFGLNLLAAFLQRYPYGGCCRLSQHLAPAICLLAGLGLSRVCDWTRLLPERRTALLAGFCLLLVVFGIGQIFADVGRPYRDPEAQWSGRLVRILLARKKPGDQVVIHNPRWSVEPLLRWHLGRYGDQFRWDDDIDWKALEEGGGTLWRVTLWIGLEDVPQADRHGVRIPVRRSGWVESEHVTWVLPPWVDQQYLRTCELSCWDRARPDGSLPRHPALGAFPP